MGKRKDVRNFARMLNLTDDYGIATRLEGVIKRRFFYRDICILLEVLNSGISRGGIIRPGAFSLLLIIARNCSGVHAADIARLLERKEIFLSESRSFRGLVLTILGRIGTPETIKAIEAAVPLFEGIRYGERTVGCPHGGGRFRIRPEDLRASDRSDIEDAIAKINTRLSANAGQSPYFLRVFILFGCYALPF